MLRRMTTQKRIVYETIDGLGHTSVEDLIQTIQNNHQQISLATIYRNIHTLLLENKIRRVKLKNQDVLETIKEDHGHFVCEECGNILDILVNKNEILTRTKKSSIHQINQCDITFYGVCQNCTNRKGERK